MQPRRQPKLLPWKMLPGLVEMKGVFAGPDLQYLHLMHLVGTKRDGVMHWLSAFLSILCPAMACPLLLALCWASYTNLQLILRMLAA